MNVVEKIIAQHALDLDHPHVTAGQTVLVRVDWCMASELTWKSMDATFSRLGRPALPAPERFWLAIDHTVDPRINKSHTKPRALIKLASDFAQEAGLTATFRPPNQEIMHTEFVRQEAAPGQLIVGADSHTCSAGAMGALAIGLGASDVLMPLISGETWFAVPEVVLIEVTGVPRFGIGGKDVIMYVLRVLRRNQAALDKVVYFAGDGLRNLSADARFAICNMCAELGALGGVCEADEVIVDVLNQRLRQRHDSRQSTSHKIFRPDAGCKYASRHVVPLDAVRCAVALFPSPDNCVNVGEVAGLRLDGVFIGACTTTQSDLILAALVLRQGLRHGLRPCPLPTGVGGRRVTPGSMMIIARLKELNLLQWFEAAGFDIGAPGCSFCVGIAADVAQAGEVWLSSQNRNFRNRMGAGSLAHLSSAACCAASAFAMVITDPAPLLSSIDHNEFDQLSAAVATAPHSANMQQVRLEGCRGCSSRTETPSATIEPIKLIISEPELEQTPVTQTHGDGNNKQRDIALHNGARGTAALEIQGRVQRFGDSVDTDAIIAAQFMGADESVLGQKAFCLVRPQFSRLAAAGATVVVGGHGFGTGSSREEAVTALKAAGVRVCIVRSFAFIFGRNLPNCGLLGIALGDSAAADRFFAAAQEGANVQVNVRTREIRISRGDKESWMAEQWSFALSPMQEALYTEGGLEKMYMIHERDLFRAAMRQRGHKASACSSVVACCSTDGTDLSW
eukprot:g1636.t1